MTPSQFLQNILLQLKKGIGLTIGSYILEKINNKDAFGSPGGSYDPHKYPGFEFHRGEKIYLLRIIPKLQKIVIEALHSRHMLINYTVKKDAFIFYKNSIVIKDNYTMTVKVGRSKSEVKAALTSAGMKSDVIFQSNVQNIKLAEFIDSLFIWAEYREVAKNIIRSEAEAKPATIRKEAVEQRQKMEILKNELNQIFYGPPGTGKTYLMQQIISSWSLIEYKKGGEEVYEEFVTGRPWWQILALTLYLKETASVPDLLQDELVKAKFRTNNVQHKPQRLWSTLQNHTVIECKNVQRNTEQRHGALIFFKDLPSSWRLADIKTFKVQFAELLNEYQKFIVQLNKPSQVKHYTFTTCHQSLTYEDFIEGIKPNLTETESSLVDSQDIGYINRIGIFYRACNLAAIRAGYSDLKEAIADSKENRGNKFEQALNNGKVHVVFLDEINRCNISAVFGELITLLEVDKRLGGINEIADCTLPYSQETFGVPLNLVVLGTMNTADRSIEALDTALRRRFIFREIPTDPSILNSSRLLLKLWQQFEAVPRWDTEPYYSAEQKLYELLRIKDDLPEVRKDKLWAAILKEESEQEQVKYLNEFQFGFSLEDLLTTINTRIEKLLDKDHKIGHSYFLNCNSLDDLKNVFQFRILPLLQEYFYGDLGKIGLVLGEGFVSSLADSTDDSVFAKFPYDTTGISDKPLYEIADFASMADFNKALDQIFIPYTETSE
jgi:hypothetical protein